MSLADQIKNKLTEALEPEFLELINESDKHIGHAGHDGSGESHFKLKVVSIFFIGLNRVQRHRKINSILSHEIGGKLHALSISALEPTEFIPEK